MSFCPSVSLGTWGSEIMWCFWSPVLIVINTPHSNVPLPCTLNTAALIIMKWVPSQLWHTANKISWAAKIEADNLFYFSSHFPQKPICDVLLGEIFNVCMALWMCGHMAAWLCGCMAVWMHGCVDAWLHDCVNVWMLSCVAVWMCECVDAWLCVCMAVWMHGCVAVWMCGCMAVWMHCCVNVWMHGTHTHTCKHTDSGVHLYIN